ncbi:hypothetical protein ACQPW1_11980 [Nocardia sp. CA-128927]|uniref:hypothetical protein n=1 Tax=Nocardia sp. CA-128927 TaxID=3239975 RepID=UPI003D97D775
MTPDSATPDLLNTAGGAADDIERAKAKAKAKAKARDRTIDSSAAKSIRRSS